VLHVRGLRPSGRYVFSIPERHCEREPVSVSEQSTLKIVSEEADDKTLDRAARSVLDEALGCQGRTSLAFVAHDIGGSVVKQALVIASRERHYSRVLEYTHLLIFSGVPNRPAPHAGWLSPLLSIVDSCFSGLRGPWIPKVLDRLVTEHDAIAKEFALLASRFRIISFYEADELLVTNRAVHTASLRIVDNIDTVKDEAGVEEDRPELSQVKAIREAAISLAMYAAQYWITHWRRDGEGSKVENYQGCKDFLAGGVTVLEGWITLLVKSSDILANEYVDEVDMVMQLLGSESLSKKQVLEYVSYAYSCPSSTPIFDRLLVLAAELADELFIKGLCEVASEGEKPFTAEAVARAIAAAPQSLVHSLPQLPCRDGAILNYSDIYLRAIQLGNISVADSFLPTPGSQTSLSDADIADGNLFACALCVAYEYGDSDAGRASQILLSESLTTTTEIATALHISMATCNTDAALKLLDLGVRLEEIGQTPLLLATQRGFTSLVRALVTDREADVNATDGFGRTALHFAAQNGFEMILRILLKAKEGEKSVIARDNEGDTPIVLAVRSEHEEVASYLAKTYSDKLEFRVSEGTKMEVDGIEAEQNKDELPPEVVDPNVAILSEAATKGFIEIVEMLVVKVTEDVILNDKNPPLHSAAKHGFTDIAKLLCEHYPALVNAAEVGDMLTPLHLACYYGQKAVVDELLKHAPDLTLLDSSSSRTPFTAACKVGALDVIASLVPALPLPANTENTNILDLGLNEAARYAHQEVVEFLLDHGGSANAADKFANAALNWAAWNRDCRLMESLLFRRCTLDPEDDEGSTPLFDATRRDAKDCVRLLVNAGANLDCETGSGCTPLDEAVYREKPELVRLLLDGGTEMKLGSYRKAAYDNLLTFAMHSSSEEVVRVLVKYYAKGRGGNTMTPATALGLVLDQKQDLVPALLESWPETKDFHSIASKASVETLKAVLKNMENKVINNLSGTNATILHAAICGCVDVEVKVHVLLDHGADPSITGGSHGTTLNAAAYFHFPSVAKLLLERLPRSKSRWFLDFAGARGTPIQAAVEGLKNATSGEAVVALLEYLRSKEAPLTHSGIFGENLLHAAARVNTRYSEDAVKWLVEKGVDPDESDIAGRRPMHLAINNGDIDLVGLLLTENTTLETLDRQRRNGLHYATLSRDRTMTSRLVDLYRGDNQHKDMSSFIEAQDVDAWTPLHWACRQADLEIVSYLIDDCKANAKALTTANWMPWHVAMYHGNTNGYYLALLPKLVHEPSVMLPDKVPSHRAYCDICYAVS
ncbi:MAG: hypothetical protein Q9211_000027, partial [Gyalolechia sp. 1 TL-2023]